MPNEPDEPDEAEDLRRSTEPHNRLTRLCDGMIDAFEAHPEFAPGDKAIIMLDDGGHGGIVLHGYDSDVEAMTNLLVHIRAVFRANGKDLDFIAIPESPEGIER